MNNEARVVDILGGRSVLCGPMPVYDSFQRSPGRQALRRDVNFQIETLLAIVGGIVAIGGLYVAYRTWYVRTSTRYFKPLNINRRRAHVHRNVIDKSESPPDERL